MTEKTILKPESYWYSTAASPARDTTPMVPASCDVVVVGAGFTGLATALFLARAGKHVVVLESEHVGFGCSGRSGGMCGPSFHKLGQRGLEKKYGSEKAAAIMAEGLATLQYFIGFVEEEKIECDLQRVGRFRGAASARDFEVLVASSERLKQTIGLSYHAVSREDQVHEIGSTLYHGGVVYEDDAGVNPFKLVTELAARVVASGGQILEGHKVTAVRDAGGAKVVESKDKSIRTEAVVVATNGYTGTEFQRFRKRLIPVTSGVIATEPLPAEVVREMSPKLRMHGGTHRLVFWYRPTPDGRRMIFGGRVLDRKRRPKEISRDLLNQARRVFPQLQNVQAEFCWSGEVAYTFDHAPHLGHDGGLHYAMGYCGSGVTRSVYFGRQLARRILNEDGAETIYDDLEFRGRPFYGGNPWFMNTMLRWNALLDRYDGNK